METIDKQNNSLIKILIAEDSITQAEKLRFVLEKHNFDVILTTNGKEALQQVGTANPDLIISDIIMPELNGFELCHLLKSTKETKDIPVILLTSLSSTEDVLDGINCGADSFITKPFEENYLISNINNVISSKELDNKNDDKKEIEIFFGGQRITIYANQLQILNLLVSTYEAAVIRNEELLKAKNELSDINEHLEALVSHRTEELSKEIINRRESEYHIQKLNRVYALLSSVNKAIIRIKDQNHLIDDICRISIEDGNFNSAWIGLIKDNTYDFKIVSSSGNDKVVFKNASIQINNSNNINDPIILTATQGKKHIVNNIAEENKKYSYIEDYGQIESKSFAAFPISFYGKTIGVFTLFSKEIDFFDEDEISLLVDLTNDISFALEYLDKENKRKLAETQLSRSEESYRAVAETASDGIITIDSKGIINSWNKAAEKIFGYESKEMIGNKISHILPDFYSASKNYHEEHNRSNETGHLIGKTKELRALKKNSEELPIELSLSEWESGSSKYFTAIIRDITERKEVENALIKAKNKAEESDKLKSAFLANMSHEIRTPMNGIMGFADLLKQPMLSGEEQVEYISYIEKSSHRMLNIINDIISISTLESDMIEVNNSETNLNELIDTIYDDFRANAEEKKLNFTCTKELENTKSKVIIDRNLLKYILEKLVSNAIKFTKSGEVEFGYYINLGKNNELEFYIKDTGIGIPEDRQNAIYERFVQADIVDSEAHQGAGLGLTIAKEYVELLGGKIWHKSLEGKGSCFYFSIPYIASENSDSSSKTEVNDGHNKNLKVLIAEDDFITQEYLSLAIGKICKEILFAENGKEAVDICRNNPDIDLILMDIKMPIMNGYEATEKIREFNKDVIIIAQTAFAMPDDIKTAINAGCNYHISKPIKFEQLMDTLNRFAGST